MMKKNSLTNVDVADAMIRRVGTLTALSQPQWGSMSSTQMLQHCRQVNQAILTGEISNRRPAIKERLLKFLILGFLGRLPKHAQQPLQLKQLASSEPLLSFETERDKLIETIRAFTGHSLPDGLAHPVFGPLTSSECGYFSWIHLSHHLRQFGV